MRLTGKCKVDFEKWYVDYKNWIEYTVNEDGETDIYKIDIKEFYEHKDSMQYGVYVDFFDSIGIMIELQVHVNPTMQGGSFKCIRPAILSDGRFHNVGASFRKRDRARTAAIEKANEIYDSGELLLKQFD